MLWAGFPSLKAQYSAAGPFGRVRSSASAAGSVPRPTVQVKAAGQCPFNAGRVYPCPRPDRKPAGMPPRVRHCRPLAAASTTPDCSDMGNVLPLPAQPHRLTDRPAAAPAFDGREESRSGCPAGSYHMNISDTARDDDRRQPARTDRHPARQPAGLPPGNVGKRVELIGERR